MCAYDRWTSGNGMMGVSAPCRTALDKEPFMNRALSLVLVIILVLLLIGMLPAWPYSAGWGYFPSGGIGLLVLILVLVVIFGPRAPVV